VAHGYAEPQPSQNDGRRTSPTTLGSGKNGSPLIRRNRLLEQENEVLRRAAAYLSQANLPGSVGK
jgi:hypothetical protein